MPTGVSSATSATVLWFLPTHGDGYHLGTARRAGAGDLSCPTQPAQATDSLGYYGVPVPTGSHQMVEPGLQPPTLAARMSVTLDRPSCGRALINGVTGGDPVEKRGDATHLAHAERYEATRAFLQTDKRLLAGGTVDFRGRQRQSEDAQLQLPPAGKAARS